MLRMAVAAFAIALAIAMLPQNVTNRANAEQQFAQQQKKEKKKQKINSSGSYKNPMKR